ncbi:MAG: hypothetical protein D6736_20645 [Nitrospinota bacterium]|nr:MAG: hypothetical protein D6736_20645 [Nitrospinota bacterium]
MVTQEQSLLLSSYSYQGIIPSPVLGGNRVTTLGKQEETMLSFLQRLYTYDHWANGVVLDTLEKSQDNASARRFLAHIIGAQQIWLARLKGEETTAVQVWPSLTLAQCRQLLEELRQAWIEFFHPLTPERLRENVSYQNTEGTRFTNPLQDILLHVAMHSAYHRGQIATAMREAGQQPAVTDYIAFVRR